MTESRITELWNKAVAEIGDCTYPQIITRFAELVADDERVAGELRCAKTPVLLDGLHEYTALKVQAMMMDAVSMRSNVELTGGALAPSSDRRERG